MVMIVGSVVANVWRISRKARAGIGALLLVMLLSTGCEDKILLFEEFCARRSNIQVINETYWDGYLTAIYDGDENKLPEKFIAYYVPEAKILYDIEVENIPKEEYVRNNIKIFYKEKLAAIVENYSFAYDGFDASSKIDCATVFSQQYKIGQ